MTEIEWMVRRTGRFTASQMHKLLVNKRGHSDEFGDKAITYIREIAEQCLTGEITPVSSKEMDWGRQYESYAFTEINKLYPSATYYGSHNPVFFEFGDYAGGSPDGEVDSKIIEIKCPFNTYRHIEHLLLTDEEFMEERKEYWVQMQFNMMCLGYTSALFFSFDPRVVDAKKQLIEREFPIDLEFCQALENRINMAVVKLNEILDKFLKQ